MRKIRSVLLSLLAVAVVAGCAASAATRQDVAIKTNLLTFSSDGTFFRSGDTHPVLSGGHGAWKRVGDKEFDATYIAFRFDQDRKWIGSTMTRIHILPGPGDNDFTGVAKVSTRDLQDNEIGTSEVLLEGKRIEVEPF
jgi:hypothetical protein